MVVALLVNQFFPSSRGLERKKGNPNDSSPLDYQEFADGDNDDDISELRMPSGRAVQKPKRKPFRAMAALTSLASDFDVVSDWIFYHEAYRADQNYRAALFDDDDALPHLIPPLLLNLVLSVCIAGTCMWLVLATDGRLITPLVRLLGHDTVSIGHLLLVCVVVEDIPQVILTFIVEDYYESANLSNLAIYNVLTSLYDTIIKLAEAYDERGDFVETGDWCKESIEGAHNDTVTSVLCIPLPPSALQNSFRHLPSARSVRGKLQKTHEIAGYGPVNLPRLRFLTTSLDKTIRLWDTSASIKGQQHEQCVRTYRGHMDGVTCVTLLGNPNSQKGSLPNRTLDFRDEEAEQTTYFVTGCKSGNCKLWNLAGTCLRSYYLPLKTSSEDAVTCVAALVEGSTFCCGYQDGQVRLWDAWTGVCISTYKGHNQSITCIASLEDGTTFISGSLDGTIKLWDSKAAMTALQDSFIAEEEPDYTSIPIPSVRRMSIAMDSSKFLTGGSVYEEVTSIKCFASHSHAAVLSVACVEPSKVFVSGSTDAIARIWSVDLKYCLRTLVGHEGPVSALLSIDKSTILTGSHDKTAKVWDAAAGFCLRTYTGHEGNVTSVSAAQDDTTFLTTSERNVKVWVVSSVPKELPQQDTLDNILEANLACCGGGKSV